MKVNLYLLYIGEGAASGNAAVLRCVPSGENSSKFYFILFD